MLEKSFEVGEEIIIGLTSDEFVAKLGKKTERNYEQREAELKRFVREHFPGRKYTIAKLYDYFGPGIADSDVEALVTSPETSSRLKLANTLRAERGFPPLALVTIEWVAAEDGRPISSTRIRRGEVDQEGRLRRQRRTFGTEPRK